jgi:SAM-dependent methyltransferase
MDLSPEFLQKNPGVEPNQSAVAYYDLPYRVVSSPENVLIVGAGTGNDVAAALRHHAQHVDAVEIDPLILRLGRNLHPEHPYASPNVTVHNDDARAYFKNAKASYDLIVFGYLDSHTMLSSYSSVRLENNVYTLQSLQEARSLLRPHGTMVLSFAGGRTFVSERIYAMLHEVFGKPPLAYWTDYDGAGVVFMEGEDWNPAAVGGFQEIGDRLRSPRTPVILATDQWPFLFLVRKTIPSGVTIVLVAFIALAALSCRRLLKIEHGMSGQSLHMFFLGAGFLLLETKGVTELSLLFGGTWITNTIVIAAFLLMAIAANALVMFYAVSRRVAYVLLFAALGFVGFFPYSLLSELATLPKVLAAGLLTALPVFFSGLIFSRSFRESADPGRALGMNLLGAVIGGALESLVMIGGTPVLGVLAILLYACSALTLIKDRRTPAMHEALSAA